MIICMLLWVVSVGISTPGTSEAFETLGERIVRAARLAVAVHLYQSVSGAGQRPPTPDEPETRRRQRRVVIGGAGPRLVDTPELT